MISRRLRPAGSSLGQQRPGNLSETATGQPRSPFPFLASARILGVLAILGAGLSLATAALKKRRGRVDHPVSKQSRTSRNLQVVGLTARVGSATVVANARKVFASAARKETLQHDLELKTASDVAATLGQMKGALMKLGQMASYIDDGLPEPARAA